MESTVITPKEKDKKESEIICFSGLKNNNPPPKKKKKHTHTHTTTTTSVCPLHTLKTECPADSSHHRYCVPTKTAKFQKTLNKNQVKCYTLKTSLQVKVTSGMTNCKVPEEKS